MKLYPVLALCIASLSLSSTLSAEQVANATCPAQSCGKSVEGKSLADFDAAVLAKPDAASCLIKAQAGSNTEQIHALTLRTVTQFAQKLPAEKLGAALQQLMQSSVQQLVSSISSTSASGTAEERNEAGKAQNLKLAAAVHELTHESVNAVKLHLAAPTGAVGPDAADGSLVIDPQAFASLMKGSMQQIIRGALAGLGERASIIPASYLPSVVSLRQDPGSYSYSLVETPLGEVLPSAVAAPIEEPAKK